MHQDDADAGGSTAPGVDLSHFRAPGRLRQGCPGREVGARIQEEGSSKGSTRPLAAGGDGPGTSGWLAARTD
jgi:hypothetical protein